MMQIKNGPVVILIRLVQQSLLDYYLTYDLRSNETNLHLNQLYRGISRCAGNLQEVSPWREAAHIHACHASIGNLRKYFCSQPVSYAQVVNQITITHFYKDQSCGRIRINFHSSLVGYLLLVYWYAKPVSFTICKTFLCITN